MKSIKEYYEYPAITEDVIKKSKSIIRGRVEGTSRKSIGGMPFKNDEVEIFVLPDNIKEISYPGITFSKCKTFVFPQVEKVEAHALKDCVCLEKIYFGSKIKEIKASMMTVATKVKDIYVENEKVKIDPKIYERGIVVHIREKNAEKSPENKDLVDWTLEDAKQHFSIKTKDGEYVLEPLDIWSIEIMTVPDTVNGVLTRITPNKVNENVIVLCGERNFNKLRIKTRTVTSLAYLNKKPKCNFSDVQAKIILEFLDKNLDIVETFINCGMVSDTEGNAILLELIKKKTNKEISLGTPSVTSLKKEWGFRKKDDENCYILGAYKGISKEITPPTSIGGIPVKYWQWEGSSNIEKINIQDKSLKIIGRNSLLLCDKLKNSDGWIVVEVDGEIALIGGHGKRVNEIIIPSYVDRIMNRYIFSELRLCERIVLPDKESIREYMKSIYVPNITVEYIK